MYVLRCVIVWNRIYVTKHAASSCLFMSAIAKCIRGSYVCGFFSQSCSRLLCVYGFSACVFFSPSEFAKKLQMLFETGEGKKALGYIHIRIQTSKYIIYSVWCNMKIIIKSFVLTKNNNMVIAVVIKKHEIIHRALSRTVDFSRKMKILRACV